MTKKDNRSQLNALAKYSNMAFQMGLTIAVFVFLGIKLDEHFAFGFPLFTTILSLFGVIGAMYQIIRGLR